MDRTAVIYHPVYSELSLPPQHRYPIEKYRQLYQRLQQEGWLQLLEEIRPHPIDPQWLKQIHSQDYVERLLAGRLSIAEIRRMGFPWSKQLVRRTLLSVGGTWLTVQQACRRQVAIHLSGGYHHATYDAAAGFCIFNDLAVAAILAQRQGLAQRILIVDTDVHQGDGTALLCRPYPDIITFSVHCRSNFPARKQYSVLDLPLEPGTGDEEYLGLFLPQLRLALATYQPDLILYDAGVDVHERDELGHLKLSTEGILQRDLAVLALCREWQVPVAAVIGGGYQRDYHTLTEQHLQLFLALSRVWGYDRPNCSTGIPPCP